MEDKNLELDMGEEVSVERLKEPGVLRRCLVMSSKAKFLVQSTDIVVSRRTTLQNFMDDNELSQKQTADIIGVSESTMSRYMTGKTTIPASCFSRLGITVSSTVMQKQEKRDRLAEVLEALTKNVKELKNIIRDEGEE